MGPPAAEPILRGLSSHSCLSCSAYTNKLITAKDHAAVQINVGHLNENGQYVDGNFTTFALAGNVRAMVRALPCQGSTDRS